MPLVGLADLKKAINKKVDDLNDQLRAVYLQGIGNIAVGTPVDTGQARANWFLTTGAPSTDSSGTGSASGDAASLPNYVLGKTFYYTNNMPYINMLEYGGYGNGPKTTGGYSDQAVGGWVRSEVMVMQKEIRNIK